MNIIDLHCDTITSLDECNESLLQNQKHIDIKKLQAGKYLLQTFAIFTPLQGTINPVVYAQNGIDAFYQQMDRCNQWIQPVTSYKQILENQKNHKISALLSLEEGDVCFSSLAMLRNYYRLGVRMIALTWNYPNSIGYPNIDGTKKNIDLTAIDTINGLTPHGIEYIQEMERLGIIIDVSHLSDAGFYDVVKHTTKPFIASHSNARSITGVGRNLSDGMIRLIASRKGVIGINYCGAFLCKDLQGSHYSTIEDIIHHIKHIVSIGGIDVVALGSDFDGIEPELELQNASYMPNLLVALQQAGFSQEQIDKITHLNALRVFKDILK